jgi:hypothetical protein
MWSGKGYTQSSRRKIQILEKGKQIKIRVKGKQIQIQVKGKQIHIQVKVKKIQIQVAVYSLFSSPLLLSNHPIEPGILFLRANELASDLASSATFFLEPALEVGVMCWKVEVN